MRFSLLIFIILLQVSSIMAMDTLSVWIMPNGASPKEKLEAQLENYTKQTGIATKIVVLDWGEAWNRISTAKIQADKVSWHQSGTLQVTKQSMTYDTCVPLQALVANGNQYECRVLTEKNGFMGLEYAVEMRPVTLLDHNKEFAAIEPLSISEDEKVIVESSRVLQSGDIVRLKDS